MTTPTARDKADGLMDGDAATYCIPGDWRGTIAFVHFRDAIAAALLSMRERTLEEAAKVADDLGTSDKNDAILHNNPMLFCDGYETGCREIAAAIRAKKEPRP
jgi:hypothetical protein